MQPINVVRRVKCRLSQVAPALFECRTTARPNGPLSPPRNQKIDQIKKAPLAAHWTAKKENAGLLSLTIQHSAVGVSGSKWEHVFSHGGGPGESKHLQIILWCRMKRALRQHWRTSQEAGVKITTKTSASLPALVYQNHWSAITAPAGSVWAMILLRGRFLQSLGTILQSPGTIFKVHFAKSVCYICPIAATPKICSHSHIQIPPRHSPTKNEWN